MNYIKEKSVPISINQAFDGISFLSNRLPGVSSNGAGFCALVNYRNGGVFLAHYDGYSEWERHTHGDEMVMVVEGETRLILLQNDEETSHLMLQSTLMIVPQNVWHRFESPKGVKILTITPQPTDHSIKRPK